MEEEEEEEKEGEEFGSVRELEEEWNFIDGGETVAGHGDDDAAGGDGDDNNDYDDDDDGNEGGDVGVAGTAGSTQSSVVARDPSILTVDKLGAMPFIPSTTLAFADAPAETGGRVLMPPFQPPSGGADNDERPVAAIASTNGTAPSRRGGMDTRTTPLREGRLVVSSCEGGIGSRGDPDGGATAPSPLHPSPTTQACACADYAHVYPHNSHLGRCPSRSASCPHGCGRTTQRA